MIIFNTLSNTGVFFLKPVELFVFFHNVLRGVVGEVQEMFLKSLKSLNTRNFEYIFGYK